MKTKFVAPILWLSILSLGHGMTLDAVLNKTLENNPEIQRAKANLEAASGRRIVLRSVAWPNVKLNLPAGVQGGDRGGSTKTKLFGFVRGSLTQPLLNTAIPHSFRRGDIEVLIAEQQLNLAVEQRLHAARLSFYSAAYNRELLSAREKQRTRLDENVASQNDRYRAGVVDRSAFTTASVEARELDPLVENARGRDTSRRRPGVGAQFSHSTRGLRGCIERSGNHRRCQTSRANGARGRASSPRATDCRGAASSGPRSWVLASP